MNVFAAKSVQPECFTSIYSCQSTKYERTIMTELASRSPLIEVGTMQTPTWLKWISAMRLAALRRSVKPAFLVACFASGFAEANPITLFNTGVDNAGTPLGGAATDTHYQLVTSADPLYPAPAQAIVVTSPHPLWVNANNAVSRWVGANASAVGINGSYAYKTTFDLTGLDPLSALISGRAAADDIVDAVLLNGNSVLIGAGFVSYKPFLINTPSWFLAGVNTLTFQVRNLGGAPTGLRVEMVGEANPIPEPTSLGLAGLGVLLLYGSGLYSSQRIRNGTMQFGNNAK